MPNLFQDIESALGSGVTQASNQAASVIGVLNNPRLSQKLNVSIPVTVTTANAAQQAPVFTMQMSSFGGYLYSIALLCDTNTQINYLFYLNIDGVTIDNNSYFQMPLSYEYDPIPEGTAWTLPPGANITLYAYNANGATINGNISVSVTVDDVGL